jgi:kynurenine formamidase
MIKPGDRVAMHQLTPKQLIGPIVLIDIGGRVQRELDKNGGKPSPDVSVTDFSEDSGNVVTAADIEAVADKLVDGAWLVLNLGWARFYFDAAPGWQDPGWEQSTYLNGWNHPGMNRESVDKLCEILDKKGVHIAGVAADNLAIDTGEGNVGKGDKMDTDVWYTHTRLLQRGVLLLENVANLDQLAMVDNPEACKLVVGSPKHVRGTGGPSRVFALCD